jgi:hypothetical protein
MLFLNLGAKWIYGFKFCFEKGDEKYFDVLRVLEWKTMCFGLV